MGSEGDDSSPSDYDWNTDDELEVFGIPPSDPTISSQESCEDSVGESSASCSSAKHSKLIHLFVGMGFSRETVIKAIDENGRDNEEDIMEALLTLTAEKPLTVEKDEALSVLVNMGYPFEEALTAIDKCGPKAHISELADFISASQLEKGLHSPQESPNNKHDASDYTHEKPCQPSGEYYLHTITERIRKLLEKFGDEPPLHVQENVLVEIRKWNLVWVGKNKLAPLEPDEYEMLLGFPRDHTRGGGVTRTERYKSLGNAFQVNTVAYHLSVLKGRFPNGINVLSLFSGIGGAEVALHRLGMMLKNVVSVEIAEVNRNIIRSWWEQTNQRGNLIEVEDVQKVSSNELSQWITKFGGFDLIIGGSPCNNISGSNRVSRHGLEGEQSSLFYEYFRIVEAVMEIQRDELL
ncbi:hypothetical protein JHK85_003254 [Glycine max]|nr:hypothetical protein JHK85_003254 [Glycine max]